MTEEEKKFNLTKEDAPKIAKAWAAGAALSVLAFTGTFALTQIEWAVFSAFVAAIVPIGILKANAAIQKWRDS